MAAPGDEGAGGMGKVMVVVVGLVFDRVRRMPFSFGQVAEVVMVQIFDGLEEGEEE